MVVTVVVLGTVGLLTCVLHHYNHQYNPAVPCLQSATPGPHHRLSTPPPLPPPLTKKKVSTATTATTVIVSPPTTNGSSCCGNASSQTAVSDDKRRRHPPPPKTARQLLKFADFFFFATRVHCVRFCLVFFFFSRFFQITRKGQSLTCAFGFLFSILRKNTVRENRATPTAVESGRSFNLFSARNFPVRHAERSARNRVSNATGRNALGAAVGGTAARPPHITSAGRRVSRFCLLFSLASAST